MISETLTPRVGQVPEIACAVVVLARVFARQTLEGESAYGAVVVVPHVIEHLREADCVVGLVWRRSVCRKTGNYCVHSLTVKPDGRAF